MNLQGGLVLYMFKKKQKTKKVFRSMKMQKFNSTGQSLSLQLSQVMKHQA